MPAVCGRAGEALCEPGQVLAVGKAWAGPGCEQSLGRSWLEQSLALVLSQAGKQRRDLPCYGNRKPETPPLVTREDFLRFIPPAQPPQLPLCQQCRKSFHPLLQQGQLTAAAAVYEFRALNLWDSTTNISNPAGVLSPPCSSEGDSCAASHCWGLKMLRNSCVRSTWLLTPGQNPLTKPHKIHVQPLPSCLSWGCQVTTSVCMPSTCSGWIPHSSQSHLGFLGRHRDLLVFLLTSFYFSCGGKTSVLCMFLALLHFFRPLPTWLWLQAPGVKHIFME